MRLRPILLLAGLAAPTACTRTGGHYDEGRHEHGRHHEHVYTEAPPARPPAHEHRRANAEKHFRKAERFARQGKYAAAEAQYRAALKIDPGYTDAHARLGYALHRLGHSDEAIHIFEVIIHDHPEYEDAYYLLADVLYVADRVVDAWHYIHAAEDHGYHPPRRLREKLRRKHPDPRRHGKGHHDDDDAYDDDDHDDDGDDHHGRGRGRGKGKGKGRGGWGD